MDSAHQILKQYWGYDNFRPLQLDIISSVMQGRDTLGLMPTGGGKSLTFQVPTMKMEGMCLVITPLIALMRDQVSNLRKRGIKAAAVYMGMTQKEIRHTLDNCIYGQYKFLYLSPERLQTDLFKGRLKNMKICLIAVDEAHCISQWGYDFRPSYMHISDLRKELAGVPLLALTATATPEVVQDIIRHLEMHNAQVLQKSFMRTNISYVVRNCENKVDMIETILKKVPGTAIVYVRSRKKSVEIAQELVRRGLNAAHFHAGIPHRNKIETQEKWTNDEVRIIVATNAFGMGIDKPDVRVVIHADLPNSLEEYFQEAGRVGRDEKKSYAVLLYSSSDKSNLNSRVSDSFPGVDFVKQVYESMAYFLQIPVNEGQGCYYEMNIPVFCRNFKLPIRQTMSALKILHQAEYIEFDEDGDNQSRLMFTIMRDDLYRLQGLEEKTDRMIQTLLRMYTGLFVDYAFIDEKLLSVRTNLTLQEVYERLIFLSKQHIIHYIPRKEIPMVYFVRQRQEPDLIHIPKEVYEDRKIRFEHRIVKMLEYANTYRCRSTVLLDYFGELNSTPCGTCDYCLSPQGKELRKETYEVIAHSIIRLLERQGATFKQIQQSINHRKDWVVETLRLLADEQVILLEDGVYYLNKDKR